MTAILVFMAVAVEAPAQNGVPGGIIAGRVLTRDGTPAAGVRIGAMAVPEDGLAATGASTVVSLAPTDASGRYRLEQIPAGRYYITGGFLDSPTYYPGVTSLSEARIIDVASGSTTENLDFTMVRGVGVRVAGRILNVPGGLPSGLLRVALIPNAPSGVPNVLQIPVEADGRFEFTKVPPGVYTARINIAPAPAGRNVVVGDSDVTDLTIQAPELIYGRATTHDGSKLPVQRAIAASLAEPPAILRLTAIRVDGLRTNTAIGSVRADGWFLMSLPAGEYRIATSLLPLNYRVKMMVSGSSDLIREPLQVSGTVPHIEMVIESVPPDPGFTVSGRIADFPEIAAGTGWVMLQSAANSSIGVIEQRIAEAPLQADGTFDVPQVPPGSYVVRALVPSQGILAQPQNVVVATQDIRGIELVRTSNPTQAIFAAGVANRALAPPPPPVAVPPPGFGIRGRVLIVPGTSMPERIRLRSLAQPPSSGIEARVFADGTFSFVSIAAGEYDLIADGPLYAGRNFTFSQNVDGIELKVPVEMRGRVVTTDGRAFPRDVQLHVHNSSSAGNLGGGRSAPIRERYYPVQSDGTFTILAYPGEQQIRVLGVPTTHTVQSVSYGSSNLLSEPLRIEAVPASEILITLAPR